MYSLSTNWHIHSWPAMHNQNIEKFNQFLKFSTIFIILVYKRIMVHFITSLPNVLGHFHIGHINFHMAAVGWTSMQATVEVEIIAL